MSVLALIVLGSPEQGVELRQWNDEAEGGEGEQGKETRPLTGKLKLIVAKFFSKRNRLGDLKGREDIYQMKYSVLKNE